MNCAQKLYDFSGRVSHRARCLYQWGSRPHVGIIGNYHGGNVGDLSLGKSVATMLSERQNHDRFGLQTIYNLQSWPETKRGIVGGGAVAYEQTLRNLCSRYGSRPQDCMLVGVDFNDLSVVEAYRDFLREVFAITCRSEEQAEEVAAYLDREDVVAHPDLSFALSSKSEEPAAGTPEAVSPPICGINIPPLMFVPKNGDWVPGSHFFEEILQSAPTANEDMTSLADAYIEFYRKACESLLAEGYGLAHVPFAGIDDPFARYVLKGLPVHFHPYRRSCGAVMSTMRRQQIFLVGRYHSLVFSLRERIPCLAFCYSPKSERLMHDLKIDPASLLNLDAIAHGLSKKRIARFISSPVLLEHKELRIISSSVRNTVNTLFDRWGI